MRARGREAAAPGSLSVCVFGCAPRTTRVALCALASAPPRLIKSLPPPLPRRIGLAIALRCARDGANVVIAAKTVVPQVCARGLAVCIPVCADGHWRYAFPYADWALDACVSACARF